MKKLSFWMFAAILTICGVSVLASCGRDDNPASQQYEAGKGDLTSVWYAEYEATGTIKNNAGEDESYSSIFERYVFDKDGTGRWSRYFMGEEPYPVSSYGGINDGDFTYTLGSNGKVSIVFNNNLEEFFPQTRELTYADGQLTSGDLTFTADTDNLVEDASNEWDDMFHMGADDLEDGNRIYGVGFGYNFILDHSKALSRAPIMRQDFITEQNLRKTSGVEADIHEATYTGNSLSELSNELAASAHVSGGKFGFKGEVGAAFDAKYKKSSEYEYALNIIDIALTNVTLEADLALVKLHLTPTFKLALLGISGTYKGEKGLYNLVRDYGTHFVCQARLGGRVRYSNTVDISKVSGEYDLTAFAKASYTGLGLTASGSIDDKFKKSYENNKSAVDTRITAVGGTPEAVLGLMEKGDESKFKTWRETLAQDDYKNTCVVSVEQVYPIWDLIDNIPERADRIKAIETYIKDGSYERDMTGENNFLVGALGKISSVSDIFTKEDDESGTLVKNLEIDGDIVAQACKEFIPQLNARQRSIVLYPVVNSKPKYNLGYFIGSSSKAPCRVCWSTISTVPSLIPLSREKSVGVQDEIYVLGCSFLHNDIDKQTIEAGQIRPVTSAGFFMETRGLNSKGEVENLHKYPLVKIFNHVWMRENFSFPIHNVYHKGENNQAYYSNELISVDNNRKMVPDGWVFPSNVTFQELIDELKTRGIQRPADNLATGGLIGFNAVWAGFMKGNTLYDKDGSAHFWSYLWDAGAKKANYTTHYYLKLTASTGNLELTMNPSNGNDNNFSVRLIQDVTW